MDHPILVVEDEKEIRELLEYSINRAGYRVSCVADAEAAIENLKTQTPSLILIDWMLPGLSGIDLARHIRRNPSLKDLPLIMLTARGEETDKLRSFDSGFDDYVTKPFSPKELNARIKALLRRSTKQEGEKLSIDRLDLDTTAHTVSIDGRDVSLRPTEYRLLEIFLRHPRRAFQRSQLLDLVWGRGEYVDERTIDVHVLRLRKALAPFDMYELIQTVRGVGYRLNPTFAS